MVAAEIDADVEVVLHCLLGPVEGPSAAAGPSWCDNQPVLNGDFDRITFDPEDYRMTGSTS